MVATHNIEAITFDQNFICLSIDGKTIKISLDIVSPDKLKTASEIQRNLFTISPSGYGIHWPLLDKDLSVNSLMKAAAGKK